MTKPNLVASSFQIVDKDGVFFPHLYDADIQELERKIEATGDTLLQRVLDWIVAESVAVSHNVKMVAERQDDGSVVVQNVETGIIGNGADIILALYDCVVSMMDLFNDIDNMDQDEIDTIDWAKGLLNWATDFPPKE